jgi:hypothetical protein
MKCQELFRERLVARQHQAAWATAGIALAQKLQITDDMLVVHRNTVEMDQQIEGDIGLELGEGAPHRPKVAADAEPMHFVTQLLERLDHVPLGAKVRQLLVRQTADVRGGHQVFVHQDDDFELLPHLGK